VDRPPSPHSSSPAMGASVPFVGRRPEVGSLKEALAAAVAGAPRILLIAVEAGMGKTGGIEDRESVTRYSRGVRHGHA
jgi:hypothetical protein